MGNENDQTQTNLQTQQQGGTQQAQTQQTGGAPAIDYEKLAEAVSGRAAAAENAALKNYLKQQGLTPEEAERAFLFFCARHDMISLQKPKARRENG